VSNSALFNLTLASLIGFSQWIPAVRAQSRDTTELAAKQATPKPGDSSARESSGKGPQERGKPADSARDHERLRFDFSGAPWLDVLQWFAAKAGLNLDWQELPADRLNLSTEREYAIHEALDVISMHLFSRGYTLLRQDQTLFVVKLDEKLNPTMVPRVEPDELATRGSHEFVRVSFPLDWMLAQKAAEELKSMLSPHGKLVPLTATNRLEAMDAVANLRAISALLSREQSDTGQSRLVAEFDLRHVSAAEIIDKLRQLLGLEPSPGRMTEDQRRNTRERFAMQAEMVRRMGDKAPTLVKQSPEIFLVVNERRNSILANAPPDKIAVIEQAVKALDIPSGDNEVRLSQVTTMKVYTLHGAESDAVVDILESLQEIGKLHADARFSNDDNQETLFAYASLQDHMTIAAVIKQLAGTARTFRVIPLRNLDANYVTTAIRALMSAGDDRWRRGGTQGSWRGFTVEADPANNQLFLFATEAEQKQVEELLARLSETKEVDGVRVISVSRLEDAREAIEGLRGLWPTISSNPLDIRVPVEASSGSEVPREALPESDLDADASEALESLGSEEEDIAVEQGPPVVIRQGPAGELILNSRDKDALKQAERLLGELLPPASPYTVIQLKHAWPFSVELKLTQAFAADEQTSGASPLAAQPLRFVSDTDTKSILVFGAGNKELQQIRRLVEFYDRPAEAVDPETIRKPEFFRLQFAEATVVADVLKSVYRDVLSPNDDAIRRDRGNGGRERVPAPPASYYDVASDGTDQKMPRYKGMLSIGVFDETNTLVVSAPAFLMSEISRTIEGLDRPDASNVTSAVMLGGGVSGSYIAERLSTILRSRVQPQSPVRDQPEQRDVRSDQRDWRGGMNYPDRISGQRESRPAPSRSSPRRNN
jgi:type II secretory pathway component GspD/PulD (secretin)